MKQKAEPVVSDYSRKRGILKEIRKYTPFLVTILIVVIAAILALVIYRYRDDHKTVSRACSTGAGAALVAQTANDLGLAVDYKLAAIALKINILPNHQDDPNCMYVITTFYFDTHQANSAQKSLNQFNKVYNGHNVNPALTNVVSVSTLRKNVADLVKNPVKYSTIGIP